MANIDRRGRGSSFSEHLLRDPETANSHAPGGSADADTDIGGLSDLTGPVSEEFEFHSEGSVACSELLFPEK